MIFSSCQVSERSQFQNLEDFHASYLQPEQFVFNTDEDIQLTGQFGTRLTIPKEAFSHVAGDIKISFKELLSKSDLVLNNIPTNTVGEQWLESGGSFYLHIQNSAGFNVYPSQDITLEFPINESIADISNMSAWTGDAESLLNPERRTPANFNIWRSSFSEDVNSNVITNVDSSMYIMETTFSNWINCDHIFESNAELTPVYVNVSNQNLDHFTVNTFVVLKDINAVLSLNFNDTSYESFPLPVGEDAFVVSIGFDEGIYLLVEPFTISKNQTIDVELEQVDVSEIKDLIKVVN